MRAIVSSQPKQAMPDYQMTGREAGFEVVRLVGALAGTGIAIIFSLMALAILTFVLVKLVG